MLLKYKDNYADHLRGLEHDLAQLADQAARMVELAPERPVEIDGAYTYKNTKTQLRSIEGRIRALSREVGRYRAGVNRG